MKYLDDVIKQIKVDDIAIFIGAQSGWLFIGNKEEYEREIDELSNALRRKSEIRLKHYTSCLQNALEHPQKEYICRTNSCNKVKAHKAYTRDLVKMIRIFNDMVKNFVPLRERIVLDIYMKDVEEGVAIIVEGRESGRYWLKGEADEERILRNSKSAIV